MPDRDPDREPAPDPPGAAAVADGTPLDAPTLDRHRQLQRDLESTQKRLQVTIDELEHVNEALRTSNEALQSTNEELLSSNEELQTSREELQSTNKELNSLNAELSNWVNELELLYGDLQNLFQSTQIATIFLDRQGRIARFTPAATAIFQLTDGDVGRPLSDFAARFDAEDVPKEVQRVFETLEPVQRTVGLVDAKCWFLMRMHPYRTPSDVIAGVVVSFIDVTKLKETEAALRQAVEERERAEQALRDADRRKNEFLGVLSHELRNPLAPIRNAIHILNRAPEGSDQASRAKAVIERQTNQLSRLVDDLLDVTRISRGKVQLRRSRVELTYLLRQVVEDHRPAFASRNVALSLSIDGRPQWIDADATRIEQVIGNLLQNAAKFTNARGHVAVRVGKDGPSQAVIQFTDDGIGIAPDMLGHVFEPFTQADDSLHRGRGGLGLGLALVKGLVEMHGGRVEARSRGLGKGTEFTISLPLLSEAGVPLESPATAPATAGRLRLLVIEDNLDAAVTLKEVLEMSGHEVAVAHDGHDGVAKARSFKPDAVLCDIGLPGLDGYEVARQIRADPSVSPTLIALTGYARPEDQRESFKAGFDHHLGKPIQIPELEQVLATAMAPPASRRILVVDDNDVLRSNIRELLEDEGWEVREARDGKEAVEAVAGFHPAVMLLDYRLPGMDGGEVLRRLGAIHAAPRVVLMTASTEVREIATQHGLRFYVPKPFRGDDLLDTVEHARSGS
jgi:two-component system CheB/CheR fusion protein